MILTVIDNQYRRLC